MVSLPGTNNCSEYNQAGHVWFQLVAFGCVSEQLCPEPDSSRAEPPWYNWWIWVQGEQLHGVRQAAWPAGTRNPNNYSLLLLGSRSWEEKPNNYSVWAAFEPGWAGTRKANNGGFLRFWW